MSAGKSPEAARRNTRQREAIRAAFLARPRPLSPAEVLEYAREQAPGLGLATVYRNLRSLVEEGWLAAVELPGQSTLYERAEEKHHHFFHCRACGRHYNVYACAREVENLTPRGFVLERHELVLYGLCLSCARKTPG